MKKTKGIILAGGSGTRMYPMTKLYSKQLINVYDKPLIYYPLSTLMLAGIKDILIICTEENLHLYEALFKDGSSLGMSIQYKVQAEPKGIAEAFIIGEDFIGNDQVVLILGDNIFYGPFDFFRNALNENRHATIFGYYVSNPERYGIIEYKDNKPARIIEKPETPPSHYAVIGLYIYNSDVCSIAGTLKPSARGELEITDINNHYLEQDRLDVKRISRGFAWLDTGTPQSLLEAANFISTIEQRQSLKIGCIEEIALRMGYIDSAQFNKLIDPYPECEYKAYLKNIR